MAEEPEGYVHFSPVEIREEAKAEACPDHPDAESFPGYGLAGGGFGSYLVCGVCGYVFGKTQEMDDE